VNAARTLKPAPGGAHWESGETPRDHVVAIPVLLGCLGWDGRGAWLAARTTNLESPQPVWYLAREARGTDVSSRDAALAELARRISEGTLPRERETALLDEAFALQADWGRPWTTAGGAR